MKINRRQMLGVLAVIASRSPDAREAAELAIDAIDRVARDVQPFYNEAAALALSDQSACFTIQEERLIRSLIVPEAQPRRVSRKAGPVPTKRLKLGARRSASFHVSVTPAERHQLGKAARAAGYRFLADYVRAMLGLPHSPPSTPPPTPPQTKR